MTDQTRLGRPFGWVRVNPRHRDHRPGVPPTVRGVPPARGAAGVHRDEEVRVVAGPAHLGGHLTVPEHATGVVVFAHGSGSSRHSPRNRYVADVLQRRRARHAAVRPAHDRRGAGPRQRLRHRAARPSTADVTRWVRTRPDIANLPHGLLRGQHRRRGSAVGRRRARRGHRRGGVPRAAAPTSPARRLPMVRAPTLLIVGGHDDVVLDLNRRGARGSCAARTGSPSSPAPPTSSRSPAPSRLRPRLPATGSPAA